MATIVYIHAFEDRSSVTPEQSCPLYQTTHILELSLYRQNLHPAEMFKLFKGEDLKVSFNNCHTCNQETETHGIHEERHKKRLL